MSSPQRSILYIAAEYRVAELKAKKHEHNLEARHASGYFDRVWSIHPTADLLGADKHRIEVIRFSSRQLVVEGVTELFRLARLLPLNFLLSQAALLRLMRRVVRKHDISVVAATDPFLSGIQAWLLSRSTGKPLVIRNGGNYEELYREAGALAMPRLIPSYRLQTMIARFVLSKAELVAGNNRNNLGWAIANGARKHTAIIPISGNIQCIHMRAPEDRTKERETFEKLGLPFGVPALIYVGRLLKLKQPDEALRAMMGARDRGGAFNNRDSRRRWTDAGRARGTGCHARSAGSDLLHGADDPGGPVGNHSPLRYGFPFDRPVANRVRPRRIAARRLRSRLAARPTAEGPPMRAIALLRTRPMRGAPSVAPPTTDVAHSIRR